MNEMAATPLPYCSQGVKIVHWVARTHARTRLCRFALLVWLLATLVLGTGCGVDRSGVWVGESGDSISRRAWAETQARIQREAEVNAAQVAAVQAETARADADALVWRQVSASVYEGFWQAVAVNLYAFGVIGLAWVFAHALAIWSQRRIIVLRPDKRGVLPAVSIPVGYTVVYPDEMRQEALVYTGVPALPALPADQRIQVANLHPE